MRVLLLSLVVLVLSSSGCFNLTPVRRTALVPTAYVPTRSGAPLERGETAVSGEFSSVSSPQLSSPEVGDPGLLVPDLTVGGSVYHGLTRWLELGVQGRYSSYYWASANIDGVLHFPAERRPDLFMYGAGARLNKRLNATRTTLSALFEFNAATIYQARYFCESSACQDGALVSLGSDAFYRFDGFDEATVGLPSFFLSQSTQIIPSLHLFTTLGVEKHYKNVGFDTTREHNPLYNYVMAVAGGGIEYKKGGWGTTLTLFLPIEEEPAIELGPSVQLQTGLRF